MLSAGMGRNHAQGYQDHWQGGRLHPPDRAGEGPACRCGHGFRRKGIRTSENEVLRIAINHLMDDFSANGSTSFLQKVISALLA